MPIRTVVLDSGPLGKLAHPKANPSIVEQVRVWLGAGYTVVIPAIVDYEVRRSFLLGKDGAPLVPSIARLDELEATLGFLPLTTDDLKMAAGFWAKARRMGRPTADDKELDGDMILAAQAESVQGIVATENVGHLGLFAQAADWRTIS